MIYKHCDFMRVALVTAVLFIVLVIYVEVRELCKKIKLLSNAHVHRMCMEKNAKEVV